ncbi:hypothetical protein PUATCC27989T_02667 [Phytobacter ursingii]|nr:hypothetical protein PUATCC27989T_02667 [Phytobacter ursingii]
MRVPSRYLFPLQPAAPGAGVVGFAVLFALLAGGLYGVYCLVRDFVNTGNPVIFAVALFMVLLSVSGMIHGRKRRARLATLAQARQGESICQFARAFNLRDVDAWVVRAVWDTVMAWGGSELARLNFPLQADDRLEIFALDDEEALFDALSDAATRAGRTLDNLENNPFLPLNTLRDMVMALNAQPMTPERQQKRDVALDEGKQWVQPGQ